MGLFDRKKKTLPALMTAADFEDVANFDSALAYLVGLGDEDYKKVCQVADIHRKAYQDSAAVLGQPNDPTTFITPPEPADDQTSDEPAYIDHIAPLKTAKQIKVKD